MHLQIQLIILQDAQVLQEAGDKVSSLLENELDNIISKSSADVGRTKQFKMDVQTTGPPMAQKPYPIPLRCQKLIDEEIFLLEDADCISKS